MHEYIHTYIHTHIYTHVYIYTNHTYMYMILCAFVVWMSCMTLVVNKFIIVWHTKIMAAGTRFSKL